MCALAELTYKDLIIYWTDGQSPTVAINFNQLYVSCAPNSLLRSLPVGSLGMASLSQSPLSLTTQFSSQVKKKFSICLPSTTTAPGVLFFGEGPFYMLPPTPFDVTTILSYTPLITNLTSLGYYIGLAGISIDGKRIRVPNKVFELDEHGGRGGVKLDTVVPYTTLRTHIYEIFVEDFSKATETFTRVKSVEPFDTCFNSTDLGYTRVGYRVPQIDLELSNGKNWTIFGVNSMKQVSNDVACLAFVDGGEMADQAVVIGSFQMEDNFLMFDLVESKLGFSSTLYFIRTTCGNFNFTTSN
ncbi:chitinase CLP [Telopea speciosissima]|uniref:chitinase CLP n=1 Tax=Telopea speciosissima TaxID=54955 RepID=UPI001CC7459C|nr:chitinase CLP [Telopea speciosissima]